MEYEKLKFGTYILTVNIISKKNVNVLGGIFEKQNSITQSKNERLLEYVNDSFLKNEIRNFIQQLSNLNKRVEIQQVLSEKGIAIQSSDKNTTLAFKERLSPAEMEQKSEALIKTKRI